MRRVFWVTMNGGRYRVSVGPNSTREDAVGHVRAMLLAQATQPEPYVVNGVPVRVMAVADDQ